MEAENRGEATAASTEGEPPALLTRVSIRPNRSTAAPITAAAWSASRTSPATNTAVRVLPSASVADGQPVPGHLLAAAHHHVGPGGQEGLD